jgi:hypothetical protein
VSGTRPAAATAASYYVQSYLWVHNLHGCSTTRGTARVHGSLIRRRLLCFMFTVGCCTASIWCIRLCIGTVRPTGRGPGGGRRSGLAAGCVCGGGGGGLLRAVFILSILWCSQSGDDLQEDLAKYSFQINMKVKFSKYPFFWGLTTWTQKMYKNGVIFLKFGQNMAIKNHKKTLDF